jgi:hypothetical protein
MSSGLVIATLESGGGIAMMGIVVLIGVLVGLVYLARGRRRPTGSLDASEQPPDASDRAQSTTNRSAGASKETPAP